MTKQKKKAETKNQHYVPQFYLRYFSVDKKNVGVYILKSGKNIPSAPIKGQASGDYFYSDHMEMEKALGALEVRAKGVIDRVIDAPTKSLSKEDKDTLFKFTVIQLGRTDVQAKVIKTFYEIPNLLSERFTNMGKPDLGEMAKDKFSDLIGKLPPFPAAFSVAVYDEISYVMRDLRVKILVNKTNKSFITSDNPVAKYNQFMERMRQETYGLGAQGLQIFFPLSPRIGVMYYDPKCYKLGCKKKEYVELDQEKDIDELNKLTACNSDEVLYYDPKAVSSQVIIALSEASRGFIPNPIECSVEDLFPNKSLCILNNSSLFCKLSLSFTREQPRFKALRSEDFDSRKHMLRDSAVHSRASY
jgi:hypothetical protein